MTAIHGRNDAGEGISSNGAGKTRLLEILPIALFGPSLPWSEYVPSGSEGQTVEVGCEFEHAGETYRVRRRYNPKGRGASETHFEMRTGIREDWKTLTRESQAESQAEITRVLGLTEETFAHSVFSKQGARHFADPSLTPKERKEILAEALGLGVYDRLRNLVLADIAVAKTEVEISEREAARLEEELATPHDLGIEHFEQDIETGQKELASATESAQEFKTLYDSARGARDALRPAQERVEAATRVLRMAEQQVETERVTKTGTLERAVTERDRLLRGAQADRQEALRLRGEADTLKERSDSLLTQAKQNPETCDRCHQPVKGDALKALVDGLLADAAALDGKRKENLAKATEFETSAAVEVERADEIVLGDPDEPFIPSESATTAHAESGKALVEARHAVELLESEMPSDEHVKTLAAQAVAAQAAETVARQTLGVAQTALGRAQADLERRNQTEDKYYATVAKMALLLDDLSVLQHLAQAYGRDGIPALIMESTAIPKIEREAERVLGRLGVPFRVELRTQAVLKSTSERLKDTLEVIVHEPAGERRYESFSGGERARINIALRLGIAQLLAHRRGAEIEVLALDEVEALDASGVAMLAMLLSELQTEIPVILFISHVEQLSEAFDTAVTVVKEDGVSRLVAA